VVGASQLLFSLSRQTNSPGGKLAALKDTKRRRLSEQMAVAVRRRPCHTKFGEFQYTYFTARALEALKGYARVSIISSFSKMITFGTSCPLQILDKTRCRRFKMTLSKK
jgi:uncharacterized protein YdiU (UPF0061 family)